MVECLRSSFQRAGEDRNSGAADGRNSHPLPHAVFVIGWVMRSERTAVTGQCDKNGWRVKMYFAWAEFLPLRPKRPTQAKPACVGHPAVFNRLHVLTAA